MHLPTDAEYMARALRLAEQGLYSTDPNPRVGCVLVRAGQIVGEGYHQRAGEPHAEVHALRAAGEHARGATAYVTLEPCCHHGRTPPCSEALLNAGVTRVVAAMRDPNPKVAGQGLAQLQAAGVDVSCGVLEAHARALNPGFISRMSRQRPWVRVKLAATLDGRTAAADGDSRWITGPAARDDVQRWRARASAILTGIGTLLADDPSLNVRLDATTRQPLRVILDSQLRTPVSARTLSLPGEVLILTTQTPQHPHWQRLAAQGAQLAQLASQEQGRIALPAVLQHLAQRDINELHVEAGAQLAGALLEAGLVDELLLYLAPLLLGDSGRGLFHLPGLQHMAERYALQVTEMRAIGHDWRITAVPVAAGI